MDDFIGSFKKDFPGKTREIVLPAGEAYRPYFSACSAFVLVLDCEIIIS